MTDKQIKDGIDVSQCECYLIEYNSCNDTLSGSCIKEKCQTFRLLQTIKAKEQECERLKESKKNSRCAWKSLEGTFCPQAQEQLYQLKAENEELEKELRQKKMTILMNNDHYFEVGQENKKLKQVLREIKEIAEEKANVNDWLALEILQKISECEGNCE